jgi:hypothetical protein
MAKGGSKCGLRTNFGSVWHFGVKIGHAKRRAISQRKLKIPDGSQIGIYAAC